jgi:hypothetical protein
VRVLLPAGGPEPCPRLAPEGDEAEPAGAQHAPVPEPAAEPAADEQQQVQGVRQGQEGGRAMAAQDRQALALEADVLLLVAEDLRTHAPQHRRAGGPPQGRVVDRADDLDLEDDGDGQLQPAAAAAPAEEPGGPRALGQRRDAREVEEAAQVAGVPPLLRHEQALRLGIVRVAARGVRAGGAGEVAAVQPFRLLEHPQRRRDQVALGGGQLGAALPRDGEQQLPATTEVVAPAARRPGARPGWRGAHRPPRGVEGEHGDSLPAPRQGAGSGGDKNFASQSIGREGRPG